MDTRLWTVFACALVAVLWSPGSARQATSHDETMSFIRTAVATTPRLMRLTTMGETAGGREMPLVIVGADVPEGPAAIRASNKIRVWIQAGGKNGADGTSATTMLLRDIATGRHDLWFTSMVLLINPIVDPDGNGSAESDHVTLASPEASAFARLLSEYDPHVSIELRTEDGPCSAYAVALETPLHPNTSEYVLGALRDDWFPFIAKNLKSKRNMETYYRGVIEGGDDGCGRPAPTPATTPAGVRRGAPPPPATGRGRGKGRGPATPAPVEPPAPLAWASTGPDLSRRINYVGLRNRFALAGVTHVRDTPDDRTKGASYFLEEALNFVWAASTRIRKACQEMDAQMLVGRPLATSARSMTGGEIDILMSGTGMPLPADGTSVQAQKRTEASHVVRMLDRLRFEPASDEVAAAEYFVPADLKAVVDALRKHGIQLRQLTQPARGAETFVISPPTGPGQPVKGTWQPASADVPAGSWVVRMNQPLARLAFSLLEPTSIGSLTAGAAGSDGKTSPILRRR